DDHDGTLILHHVDVDDDHDATLILLHHVDQHEHDADEYDIHQQLDLHVDDPVIHDHLNQHDLLDVDDPALHDHLHQHEHHGAPAAELRRQSRLRDRHLGVEHLGIGQHEHHAHAR